MNDFFKTVIGRVVGAGVGAAAGYLAGKGLPTIDPDASAQLTNAVTGGVMLGGYAIVHKLVNRKVNPNDTAKS